MNDKSLKNLEKRKRYSKDYQPANKGRKKSVIKQLMELYELDKKEPLGKSEAEKLMAQVSIMSTDELKALIKNKETPAFLAVIASALLSSVEKGDMSNLDKVFNRMYGFPKQEVEQNTSINYGYTQEDLKVLKEKYGDTI